MWSLIVVLGLVLVVILVLVLVALGMRAGKSREDDWEDEWEGGGDDRPYSRNRANADRGDRDRGDMRVAGPTGPPEPDDPAPAPPPGDRFAGPSDPGDLADEELSDDDYWAHITFDKPQFPWRQNGKDGSADEPDSLGDPLPASRTDIDAANEQTGVMPAGAPLGAPTEPADAPLAAGLSGGANVPEQRPNPLDAAPTESFPASGVNNFRNDPLGLAGSGNGQNGRSSNQDLSPAGPLGGGSPLGQGPRQGGSFGQSPDPLGPKPDPLGVNPDPLGQGPGPLGPAPAPMGQGGSSGQGPPLGQGGSFGSAPPQGPPLGGGPLGQDPPTYIQDPAPSYGQPAAQGPGLGQGGSFGSAPAQGPPPPAQGPPPGHGAPPQGPYGQNPLGLDPPAGPPPGPPTGPAPPGAPAADGDSQTRLPTVEELLQRVQSERQGAQAAGPDRPRDPLNDPLPGPLGGPPGNGAPGPGGPDLMGSSFGASGFSPGQPASGGPAANLPGTGGPAGGGFGYGNDQQLHVPGTPDYGNGGFDPGPRAGTPGLGTPQPPAPGGTPAPETGYTPNYGGAPGQGQPHGGPAPEPGNYGDFTGASYSNGASDPLRAPGAGAAGQPQPGTGYDSPVGTDYYGTSDNTQYGQSGYGAGGPGGQGGQNGQGGQTPEPHASHYGGDRRKEDWDAYGGGGYSR